MKRTIILGLFMSVILILAHAVLPVKKPLKQAELQRNIPNQTLITSESLFYLKYPKQTIDEYDLNLLKKLRTPSKLQLKAWLVPIVGRGAFYSNPKFVSIQKKTTNYTAFTILRVFDIGADSLLRESLGGEQYLITVDQKGKYINSLKIFDNFRTDDRDEENIENNFDKEIGAYIIYNTITTTFTKDTIKVNEFMSLTKDFYSSKKESYFNKTFLTKYVLNENGILQRVAGRTQVVTETKE